MLWDRGEPNGYAHRMTDDPLPNTPPHKVLLNVAFGDHQVTNWQADVEARTIGAKAHAPVVYPGRWPDVDVLWDIPRITSYPFTGSAIVYWDSGPPRPDPENAGEMIGTDPPPIGNLPNRSGADPHSGPRLARGKQQEDRNWAKEAKKITILLRSRNRISVREFDPARWSTGNRARAYRAQEAVDTQEALKQILSA